MNRTYLLIILASLTPIILVITYRTQIDTFFGTTNASNYLLVGLILVDFLGNFLLYYMGKRDEKAKKSKLRILGVDRQDGTEETTLRLVIFNEGKSTAKECSGLISLEHTRNDVRNVSGYPTLITPDNYANIDGYELCWLREGSPSQVNIPVYGKRDLEIVRIVHKNREPALVIPSDQGWGNFRREEIGGTRRITIPVPDRFARIGLVPKSYTGFLSLNGDDVDPMIIDFTILYNEQSKNISMEYKVRLTLFS